MWALEEDTTSTQTTTETPSAGAGAARAGREASWATLCAVRGAAPLRGPASGREGARARVADCGAPSKEAERAWLVTLEQIQASHDRGDGPRFKTRLSALERGQSTVRMSTEGAAGGASGGVHGGLIATLVDIALVTSAASMCRAGEELRGTAELNVSYLRPALGVELVATCRILKKGRSLVVGDIDVESETGLLLAKGRGLYAVGPAGGGEASAPS